MDAANKHFPSHITTLTAGKYAHLSS